MNKRTGFSAEQGYVIRGVLAAAVTAVIVVVVGLQLSPPPTGDFSTPGTALAYALKADLWMLPLLFAGITAIANGRFLSKAIDGRTTNLPDGMEINHRYLQNTVEQLLLALPTHLALAALLPATELRLIPLLVGLFVVGRLTFWLGYREFPTGRAYGFALTFYPTVGALVYAVYLVLAA